MTLLELLELIKKHIKLVIALPVLFALVVGAWSFLALNNTYTASVSFYVLSKTQSNDNQSNIMSSDLQAGQSMSNDIAELVKGSHVQNDVASALGMKNLADYKISVSSATTNRIVSVSVTGEKPDGCVKVANQIAKTTDQVAREVMGVESVNVVNEAYTPSSPSGPPRLVYTGVAFLAGLFLAIAWIIVLDLVNTRVRSGEEAAELLGLPLLAQFPKVDSKGGK